MATTSGPPVPAFATIHDLATNLGGEKQAVAIERATDLVRAELDQQLTPPVTDDVVVLQPRGHRVIQLPQLPVTKVTSVAVRPTTSGPDQMLTEGIHYRVDLAHGWVERMPWGGWPHLGWQLVVTYDHGYEHLPPELTRLTAAVADKILDGKIEVRQQTESWGSHNVSVTYARVSDTVFSDSELKVLEKYRPVKLP